MCLQSRHFSNVRYLRICDSNSGICKQDLPKKLGQSVSATTPHVYKIVVLLINYGVLVHFLVSIVTTTCEFVFLLVSGMPNVLWERKFSELYDND